MKQANKQTI